VPYATTLALEQFFDGGSIEEHLARRTTPAVKPSPLSPHHHHNSRRKSRHSSAVLGDRDARHRQQQQQQQQSPLLPHSASSPSLPSTGTRESIRSRSNNSNSNSNSNNESHRNRPTPPVLAAAAERDNIGKGASLPVVDEKGQVWLDWEEKQEYAPLLTDENERSGWVDFPGAAVVRSSSTGSNNSHNSRSDGSSDASGSSVKPPLTLPLHAILDAFTFQTTPALALALAPTPAPKDPLHGLQVPPGARPRGKDRRIVRRADSLPMLLVQAEAEVKEKEKEAAAREFLDASFDPVKGMLAMQLQHPTATVSASAIDASPAHQQQQQQQNNGKLGFGARASVSMKGLKKMIFRKKSTSP
jgi:hypothetical protein